MSGLWWSGMAGTVQGLANELTLFNGIAEDLAELMANQDKLGSDWGYNHYPVRHHHHHHHYHPRHQQSPL
jgi:hypothetical protein